MRRRPLSRVAGVTAVLAAVVLAGCGSGGSGASHDSPAGAVRGFADALSRNDIGDAQQWVAPAERQELQSLLSPLNSQGLKASFQVKDFEVVSSSTDSHDPDKAVVHYRGSVQVCISGAINGQSFNTCEAQPIASHGTASDTVDTVKVNGQWYVTLGIGSTSGSGSSSASSSSGAGQSVSTGSSPPPTETSTPPPESSSSSTESGGASTSS